MAKAKKLGEILVQLGFLTPERLDAVLMHQRQWGVSLGRAAVAKNFCTEAQVLEALSRQLGFPAIALDGEELNPMLSSLLSQKDAEKHHAVPIRLAGARGEVLVVAMAAPATVASQDAVLALTRKARLQIFLATDEALHLAWTLPHAAVFGSNQRPDAGQRPLRVHP
jgi:type IV pilus assembly protein PilB